MSDAKAAWAELARTAAHDGRSRIESLFAGDPARLDRLTFDAAGLHVDLSKQPWSQAGVEAAIGLARAADVEGARTRLIAGDVVNTSEGRAAQHMALRAPAGARFEVAGEAVSPLVDAGRATMWRFVDEIRSGARAGAGGAPFRAVVHIGIGGSDLGPRLVWEALAPIEPDIDLRFAANVDPSEMSAALAGLNPQDTLVVVVSKTFTTQETLANAEIARAWLRASLGHAGDAHLVAVSAAPAVAQAFGVPADQVFAFWDWVGGRFSVWSAVGLSCAIALGHEIFQHFLAGAAQMDAHFASAPLEENLPVMLALAHVFNRNGLGRTVRAVVPYARRLRLLPDFLQQLEMESNGKRVDAVGRPVAQATAAAVFGGAGTNVQHAFFQLLHQGTDVIPVDIVAVHRARDDSEGRQAKLLANAVAQAEALMVGRTEADVRQQLQAQGAAQSQIDALAPQRAFPGDRPSSFILLERLTPETLGALIALYEHKTFVEGVLWGINSFDQWGVELGKSLAGRVLAELEGGPSGTHDPSTAALIRRLKD
ncbi:glucose-6-phosphate isomerase [Phenylobacterium sp.]|uniref:glucose-6-phosphate isomerase n=1 Tax=Phenylobacterium sp. TaxID=1871053 RepID=UPI002734C933|nr:glucose-6-phosphate isomerase [Phenylobacterium sp.]MDP3659442.1 glucose-6-phosphate isomerase [Phenylobacterium sp.]